LRRTGGDADQTFPQLDLRSNSARRGAAETGARGPDRVHGARPGARGPVPVRGARGEFSPSRHHVGGIYRVRTDPFRRAPRAGRRPAATESSRPWRFPTMSYPPPSSPPGSGYPGSPPPEPGGYGPPPPNQGGP